MTGPRIAHFVRDPKFAGAAHSAFEAVLPGGNRFHYLSGIRDRGLAFPMDVVRGHWLSLRNPRYLRSLASAFDVLVLHGMDEIHRELACRVGTGITRVWIGMGYDYLDLMYSGPEELLRERTLAFYSRAIAPRKRRERNALLQRLVRTALLPHSRLEGAVVNRVDFFAPVLEEEFVLIEQRHPGIAAEFLDWNYGVHSANGHPASRAMPGKSGKVLLGNSASPFGNHLDALPAMSDIAQGEELSILCPLSYGDPVYRDEVVREGRRWLGRHFVPITRFLGFADYAALIASCQSVVMPHRRQQAGGNLVLAIAAGARIFLDPESPFYQRYLRQGMIVHGLDVLETDPQLLAAPLSAAEADHNRQILDRLSGREVVLEKTRRLIDRCTRPR